MSQNVATGYNVAFAITKSNTVNAPQPFDAVYCGGAGDVVIVLGDAAETPITFKAAPVGAILPIAGIRINATGTTDTNFTGLRRV